MLGPMKTTTAMKSSVLGLAPLSPPLWSRDAYKFPRIPRVAVVVSNMEAQERENTKAATETEGTSASCSTTTAASETDDDAEKLDFCSEKFDPLLALYSPNVTPPFPNIQTFNNVSDYESFLKGGRGRAKPDNVEKRRLKAMKGVVDVERIERLKKLMVNNPVSEADEGGGGGAPRRRRQPKPQKNVLTRMPLCKGSPLGELFRCVEERIRVKVHIRTFKGLRGVCSGFVVAFDKFWNMAMVDVDETYREPLRGEALYHEKTLSITRLFEKLKLQETSGSDESEKKDPPKATDKSGTCHSSRTESTPPHAPASKQKREPKTYGKVRTRHVNQLFIRGENIILVNPQPL